MPTKTIIDKLERADGPWFVEKLLEHTYAKEPAHDQ